MPVSKDVIRDLLPVYLAGEASTDTRVLVEEFLARDPELRALADAAGRTRMPGVKDPDGLHALELSTLNRTRRLLARKSFVLGIALLFTFLPMTTVFRKGEIVLVLARDYPDAASGLLLNAAIAWMVYLDTRRRLCATGLEAPWSGHSRFLSTTGGIGAGCAINAGGAALGGGAEVADVATATFRRDCVCDWRLLGSIGPAHRLKRSAEAEGFVLV